jgi:hypothetical protein
MHQRLPCEAMLDLAKYDDNLTTHGQDCSGLKTSTHG